jgi:hypothetical protein
MHGRNELYGSAACAASLVHASSFQILLLSSLLTCLANLLKCWRGSIKADSASKIFLPSTISTFLLNIIEVSTDQLSKLSIQYCEPLAFLSWLLLLSPFAIAVFCRFSHYCRDSQLLTQGPQAHDRLLQSQPSQLPSAPHLPLRS